jgi:hypothetical protein
MIEDYDDLHQLHYSSQLVASVQVHHQHSHSHGDRDPARAAVRWQLDSAAGSRTRTCNEVELQNYDIIVINDSII